jgi:hypothetical protein
LSAETPRRRNASPPASAGGVAIRLITRSACEQIAVAWVRSWVCDGEEDPQPAAASAAVPAAHAAIPAARLRAARLRARSVT